jgi:hypothetical protein
VDRGSARAGAHRRPVGPCERDCVEPGLALPSCGDRDADARRRDARAGGRGACVCALHSRSFSRSPGPSLGDRRPRSPSLRSGLRASDFLHLIARRRRRAPRPSVGPGRPGSARLAGAAHADRGHKTAGSRSALTPPGTEARRASRPWHAGAAWHGASSDGAHPLRLARSGLVLCLPSFRASVGRPTTGRHPGTRPGQLPAPRIGSFLEPCRPGLSNEAERSKFAGSCEMVRQFRGAGRPTTSARRYFAPVCRGRVRCDRAVGSSNEPSRPSAA